MIEISKSHNNTYLFQLKTSDGQTLLESISFNSREEIENTVAELAPLSEVHVSIERKTNYQGNFLFNLKDRKGKVIGNSLLYDSEAGMENGIRNLKRRIASLSSGD